MRTNQFIKASATAGGILLASIIQGYCGTAVMGPIEPASLHAGAGPFHAYASENGFCTAVSQSGRIFSSPDETTWSDIHEVNNSMPTFFRGVTHGNNTFVVVGGSYVSVPGVIVTLKRSKAWTFRDSGTRNNLYSVTFGNGRFVAVGDHDTILTSKDAIYWRKRTSGTSNTLFACVAFGNGTFVAVGDSGNILTSTDGVKWQARPSGTSMYLNNVHYDAGAFLAMGAGGLVLVSTNGIAWVSRRPMASSLIGVLQQSNESCGPTTSNALAIKTGGLEEQQNRFSSSMILEGL